MSADAGAGPGGPQAAGGGFPEEDEQMREQRAAYEAELSRISVPDMLMQASVTLLNLSARRLGPAPDRDLDQARDGIDAVRALLEVLERRMPGELRPLRDALSQLQLAYAAEVGGAREQAEAAAAPGGEGDQAPGSDSGGGRGEDGEDGEGGEGGDEGSGPGGGPGAGPAGGEGAGGGAGEGPCRGQDDPRRPGPAETSGRLWVPGR